MLHEFLICLENMCQDAPVVRRIFCARIAFTVYASLRATAERRTTEREEKREFAAIYLHGEFNSKFGHLFFFIPSPFIYNLSSLHSSLLQDSPKLPL